MGAAGSLTVYTREPSKTDKFDLKLGLKVPLTTGVFHVLISKL